MRNNSTSTNDSTPNSNPTPPDSPVRSADPFHQADRYKGTLIWNTARLIENVFSHKGMFWLGVTIALTGFIINCSFYFRLLLTLDVFVGFVLLGAFLISFGTTLFEIMPVLLTRSRRNNLNQIFHAASKPTELPVLNDKVHGDAQELLNNYRNSDRDTRNFFKTMRWVAIGTETFLGILFLGGVGIGVGALLKLMVFIGSIFQTEWGVSLAIRASEWELPPAIRKQMDDLIQHSGRALNLKRIDS